VGVDKPMHSAWIKQRTLYPHPAHSLANTHKRTVTKRIEVYHRSHNACCYCKTQHDKTHDNKKIKEIKKSDKHTNA
jgi:hypothetical protein